MDKAPETRPAAPPAAAEPKAAPETPTKPFKLRSGLRAGYVWGR